MPLEKIIDGKTKVVRIATSRADAPSSVRRLRGGHDRADVLRREELRR